MNTGSVQSSIPRQAITAEQLRQDARNLSTSAESMRAKAQEAKGRAGDRINDSMTNVGATIVGTGDTIVQAGRTVGHAGLAVGHVGGAAAGAVGTIAAVPLEGGAAGFSEGLEWLGRGILKMSEAASAINGTGRTFTVGEQAGNGRLLHEKAADFTAAQYSASGRQVRQMVSSGVEVLTKTAATGYAGGAAIYNFAAFAGNTVEYAGRSTLGPAAIKAYDLGLRASAASVEAYGHSVEKSGKLAELAGKALIAGSNASAQGTQNVETVSANDELTKLEQEFARLMATK